jgi:hypothetical protein
MSPCTLEFSSQISAIDSPEVAASGCKVAVFSNVKMPQNSWIFELRGDYRLFRVSWGSEG